MSLEGADVIRVNGCPGGGKTTWLFNRVSGHARDGLLPDDMYYLTFTRSGREEVAERLLTVFDGDEDEITRRAKTFHGAACSVCFHEGVIEDVGEQVIIPGSEVHEEFCMRKGLAYAPDGGDPLIAQREGDDISRAGNQLFGLANWLKYTQNPPEMCNRSPSSVSLPTGYKRTVELLNQWEEFKQRHYETPRFEHADYVDEAIERGLTPAADVLFIDEFQDLSPQEYLLYHTWQSSGMIDRIYIAGDANQSIYSFRAGTPRYFVETSVSDTEQRTVSYRCPAEIVNVARGVLEAHPETDPNGFRAKKTGGSAERVGIERPEQLANMVRNDLGSLKVNDDGNSVFMLTRTNKQVRTIASALDDEGVPYSFFGRDDKYQPWGGGLSLVYQALQAITDGQSLTYKPAEFRGALLDHLPKSAGYDSVQDIDMATPAEIIRQLNLHYYDRERLKSAVRAGQWTQPTRVKIGTIHSSKGLEAPCVYLFDSYPSKLRQQYADGQNAAEEHRLYYVGATRASETLRVITGFDGMGTEAFPPFSGELPRASGVVVQ